MIAEAHSTSEVLTCWTEKSMTQYALYICPCSHKSAGCEYIERKKIYANLEVNEGTPVCVHLGRGLHMVRDNTPCDLSTSIKCYFLLLPFCPIFSVKTPCLSHDLRYQTFFGFKPFKQSLISFLSGTANLLIHFRNHGLLFG